MRPLRDTAAGLFHVYTHSVWAAPAYFRDNDDRLVFVRRLARATQRFEWTCVAYCLLGTHYHLILEVGDGVLPRGMQWLNFGYAMYFNGRHRSRGHVQMSRYGSRRIEDDSDLLGVFRYMAWNPPKAELCRRPQDWIWSTYAGTVGLAAIASFVDPSLVLATYDLPRELAMASLRKDVEES